MMSILRASAMRRSLCECMGEVWEERVSLCGVVGQSCGIGVVGVFLLCGGAKWSHGGG